jgi:hypothetical protein
MAPEDLVLEVRGVGPVRLPVSAQQAKQLIGVARPARYGRGEATLLDRAVRDTWEVPKSRVKVDKRRWHSALGPVLDRLGRDLGLPDGCRLKPDLHSMLVYAPGQHFVAHQDSEKADGMVASLVVTLPGTSTGGTLVVEHGTERATYRGSRDRLSLVALYADCRHEIRPVRSGFRVVLTYNLLLEGDTTANVTAVPSDTVDALARCLQEHFTTPVPVPSWRRDQTPAPPPDRLVYLLDHEYTSRALGWARLKGSDATYAAAIRAAAEQCDCEVMLALADVHETWSAFEPEYRWGWRSRHSTWADYEDDDERDDFGLDDYELDALIESQVELVRWAGQGTSGEAISTSVGDEEVCASTPSVQLTPYESTYEPYMGNYGNTMDRWYKRAAIVLWPRARAFAVRAEASPRWALDQVAAQLDAGKLDAARGLLEQITPSWARVAARSGRDDLLSRALTVGLGVDDAGLASVLLGPFGVEQLDITDAGPLAASCDRYGGPWLAEVLTGWSGRERWGNREWAVWLEGLPDFARRLAAIDAGGATTARLLVRDAWNRLERSLEHRSGRLASPSRRSELLADLVTPLVALLASVAVVRDDDLRREVLGRLGSNDGDVVFDRFLVDVVRAGLDLEDPALAGVGVIADWCSERIERRLARPVRSADDWSILLPAGCDCELCGTLAGFLSDPTEQRREWPIAKPKRQHVHRRIDDAELPVTHRTLREGRPHKLVLTKTAELFEREAQDRARDETDRLWLRQVADDVT